MTWKSSRYLEAGSRCIRQPNPLDADLCLRAATRARFVSDAHYADAVEAAVKVLNEVVRTRTKHGRWGSVDDQRFLGKQSATRINPGRSASDKSAQRRAYAAMSGRHRGTWRAHAHTVMVDDSPRER